MKTNRVKWCIKSLGAIEGLIGCIGLFYSLLFLATSVGSLTGIEIGIGLVCAALYGYFIYIGYLAWFRWSPVAVQNVIDGIAFILFGILGALGVIQVRVLQHATTASRASLVLFLGSSVLFYAFYSWCRAYCCARLFPPAVSA